MEDQVVAVLNLGKEEAVLTTGVFALFFGEERSEVVQPLATAEQQIVVCWKSIFSSRRRLASQ